MGSTGCICKELSAPLNPGKLGIRMLRNWTKVTGAAGIIDLIGEFLGGDRCLSSLSRLAAGLDCEF